MTENKCSLLRKEEVPGKENSRDAHDWKIEALTRYTDHKDRLARDLHEKCIIFSRKCGVAQPQIEDRNPWDNAPKSPQPKFRFI
jgi:23S rRNA C2498 (ribose-2'-O)-methylase RlmM